MAASASSVSGQTPTGEATLDVSLLKELARKALLDGLNSVNGAKTLVLDASLAGPLGLVTEVSLLKHHGVEKMFWLESGPMTSPTANIVYLCRPRIQHIKIIADQIKRHGREGEKHIYTLLLVPRTSTLATRILEEEGVLGEITIAPYNLQFIPLADDVISLELDGGAFREIWADGDETAVYDSAQALITLERIHGLFPRIVGKGTHAARLVNLLERNLPTGSNVPDTLSTASEKMDCLIVLDRRVDMVTPLLTQLTYEGLIDEVMGISNSHAQIPASLLTPQPQQTAAGAASSSSTAPIAKTSVAAEQRKKYHLSTATDPLLAELRDLNFAAVGKKLHRTALRLAEDINARLHAKTVAQLRDFVGKLGGLQTEQQALRVHTGLSELLDVQTKSEQFERSLEIQQNILASYELPAQVAAIDDMIARGSDMHVVLRLLCLASIIGGGIKPKTLENIKREFLQAYGYQYLPLLLTLSAPPLYALLPQPVPAGTPRLPYAALRKQLRLLLDDADVDELENDVSYAYSGYAPLSVRLVQCVAQKGGVLATPAAEGTVQAHPIVGWKGFEDVLASIPGETVDIVQKSSGSGRAALLPHTDVSTTTVVFFLGGCTYAEIAALRWVGRQNRGRKFLVATTGMITGRTITEGLAVSATSGPASKDAAI